MYIFYNEVTGDILYAMNSLPINRIITDKYIKVNSAPTELGAWKIENDMLVLNNLEQLKTLAIDRVNTEVGIARTTFITEIPGQQMIYQAKEKEALEAIKDPSIDPSNYPFLQVEASLRNITIFEAAELIISLANQIRNIGVVLEGIRLTTNMNISSAVTENEITTLEELAYSQIKTIIQQ